MTPDTIALARRLLALGVEPFVVPIHLGPQSNPNHANAQPWRDHRGILWRFVDGAWLPDVGDDSGATQGVMLRTVRRKLGCGERGRLCLVQTRGGDSRVAFIDQRTSRLVGTPQHNDADALVAALELASSGGGGL